MKTNTQFEDVRSSHNPLFRIAAGIPVKSTLPPHRQAGRVGALWFEYVQGVRSLRGVVRSGEQIAEFFAALDMLTWDRELGTYEWKGEPLTRAAFLKMIGSMQEGATARLEAGA